MIALVALLLFRVSLASAFSRFINTDKVLKNVDTCKQLYFVTDDMIVDIYEHPIVFSQINNTRQLCFLQCLYQISELVDSRGVLRRTFISSIIRAHISLVDLEYSANENNEDKFTENILLICNNTDSKDSCFSSVESVECLEAVLYLYRYGYMELNIINERFMSSFTILPVFSAAVEEFQKYFSLKVTGNLDRDTLSAMYYPRCSLPDIENHSYRNKRYALYKTKWKKLDLTYRISRYPKKLSRNMVDKEISRAFDAWMSVSNLTFEKSEYINADITLRFERRLHGDAAPFDGPGDVLAHAFYPLTTVNGRQNSYIHFDNAEKWTANSEAGVNLYQVAVHEIGHSLGLKHSKVKESVMWPKHDGYVANFSLHADDIKAIQVSSTSDGY